MGQVSDQSHQIARIVKVLGGWPKHFRVQEKRWGENMLAQLIRDRVVDEGVFFMVVRYATHAAAYERLGSEIKDSLSVEGSGQDGISLMEQERAYHGNKVSALERDLVATPWLRKKLNDTAQTNFLDRLFKPMADDPTQNSSVVPLQPMKRNKGV